MKSYLLKILDLRPGEGPRVALLLTMGFSMGMFLATLTVASSSLFLANFDEEVDLPKAFLISGFIGLAATIVYNFLQNRIPFPWLAALSLLTISGLTAVLEFGGGFFANQKDLYFIGFTLILPFSYITNLVFWGSCARLFSTRQAKRLLGTVDAGAMIASFIAYFSIPILLKKLSGVSDLYAISLVSIAIFLLLYLYLSTRYLYRVRTFSEEKKYYKKIGIFDLFRNRYVFYLSSFVVIAMMVMNFVDYSFLNVTTLMIEERYYAEFLSYFEMTIVIFNFLFQSFVTDKIVKEYGMKVAMLINPVLIGLFTISAIGVGYSFGYSPQDNLFIIFFISIAMCKLFISSLSDALDIQTFRLYLLPIDGNVRIDVQTKIEGLVTAFATLAAGALIILINKVGVFDLFSITIFTLPLVAAWYFISNRMHSGYQFTLRQALERNKTDSGKRTQKRFTVTDVLENNLTGDNDENAVHALNLMEKLEPAMFEHALVQMAKSSSSKIRMFAEDKLHSLGMDKSHPREEVRKLALQAYDDTAESDLVDIPEDKLVRLAKSSKHNDRILAAKLLHRSIHIKTLFVLLELLRDPHPQVKYEALHTARKAKRPESWPILIELLQSPVFSHHAAAALKEAGESVLPVLNTAFHKTGQSEIVMLRIVQIIGRIGGNYALKLLWRKIDFPDKRIVREILCSLRYIQYQAKGKEAREVMSLLETEIGKALWNLAALHELPETENFYYLRQALQEEVQDNHDQIIMLLSLLYDPQSVELVRENIASGNADSIAFAIELMDIFIDGSLKVRLFPLLDQSSVTDKLKQLQTFYPREHYKPVQVINYLMNRDVNLTNRWTKACAIHAAVFLNDFRISRGLVAHLFNQDKLLQETAAWVIYHKDRETYHAVSGRIPPAAKRYVEESIGNNQLLNGLEDGFFLNIEMIMAIRQLPMLENIHGNILCDLADKITPLDMNTGSVIQVHQADPGEYIFIVAFGQVKFQFENHDTIQVKRGHLYGDILQQVRIPGIIRLEALERSVVFKISLMDFYFVMANHHELVDGLLKNISRTEAANLLQDTITAHK